ncbi:MAG: DUF1236 domain-containing protein [Hyphomicrobiaceae bacterium]|nr:DUF1236 domain-containing protein [Hyphomicrobiaceae bacterium]
MKLRTIGAASALALFAGMAAGAYAQAPGGQAQQAQRPQQQEGQAPGQGAQQMGPGQQQQRGGQAPQRKQRKQAEQPERKERQQAEQPERKERQKAEQPDRKERQKAEQPERKERQQAEQPERKERAEGPRLTEEQRTTVRRRIRDSEALERARVASVDFDISVGTRVPRERVRLVPLPAVIVETVPAYRGYLFFVVNQQIVIVSPATYVVVDVLRLDGAPGRAAAADVDLTLSSEQRRLILTEIDLRPGIRLGIGDISVGMSVPGSVELRRFPQPVIAEIPELEDYRYFVFEQQVAIVDPGERQVVLTISD